MLNKIVDILNASNSKEIDGYILLCQHTISDKEFITELFNSNFIENTITDNLQIGNELTLEFSLPRLTSIGFYKDWPTFLKQNYYKYPLVESYSFEDKTFLGSDSEFSKKFKAIISLIESILKIAKHSYEEEEIYNAIILREDATLFLPLMYSFEDLKVLDDDALVQIIEVAKLYFEDKIADKKSIFLNTMVEYLIKKKEEKRFSYLIQHFSDFFEKALVSYNFFLKDFSFNKLKLEIDTKALDFNQKLQGVINDSQGKLIAIPTAFVLVLTTFDFEKVDIKNWTILFSTIIFTFFIQIFLQNQKSALKFIRDNIEYYKFTFTEDLIRTSDSFIHLESEYKNQKRRVDLLQFLLWLVPVSTTSIFFYVYGYRSSWMITVLYFLIYLIVFLVEYYTRPIKIDKKKLLFF